MEQVKGKPRELKGAIQYAEPEFYSRVVDWCAKWMARLEREDAQKREKAR